ncbi:MAG: phytanoyl-CoA dioxygenase family protein, partial [Planctomycetota bacterium]|nr:phytanoyl-CoA dioxygenase family protein [Planctomycetota bacterium]
MKIELRDEMFSQYFTQGYLIFRNVIPGLLLKEMRKEADKARELAWELNGPSAQRLQPIEKYADRINQKPFQDYCELPNIAEMLTRLLGSGYTHGHRHLMGILVEPKEVPWNQGWHRDGPVEVPLEAQDEILRKKMDDTILNMRVWNQVNCALYNDACTWYVPGSHLRTRDLPGEVQSVGSPALSKDLEGLCNEEREIINIRHCRAFPGAVQTQLGAGDYMIYRNFAWHCGNYVPYQPRATIHDGAVYHYKDGESS